MTAKEAISTALRELGYDEAHIKQEIEATDALAKQFGKHIVVGAEMPMKLPPGKTERDHIEQLKRLIVASDALADVNPVRAKEIAASIIEKATNERKLN